MLIFKTRLSVSSWLASAVLCLASAAVVYHMFFRDKGRGGAVPPGPAVVLG